MPCQVLDGVLDTDSLICFSLGLRGSNHFHSHLRNEKNDSCRCDETSPRPSNKMVATTELKPHPMPRPRPHHAEDMLIEK